MARAAITLAIAACAFAAPASAASLSGGRVSPHIQGYAICEAGRFTDWVNTEWAAQLEDRQRKDEYVGYPSAYIYSDTRGKIGLLRGPGHNYAGNPASELDLIEDLRTSNGKNDEGPIVASRLVLLQRDKFLPVYLISLRRKKWERYSLYPSYDEVQRYEVSNSVWIMQFAGNELHLMREAQELAPTAARGRNLLTRKIDCPKLWAREQ